MVLIGNEYSLILRQLRNDKNNLRKFNLRMHTKDSYPLNFKFSDRLSAADADNLDLYAPTVQRLACFANIAKQALT